MPDGDQIDVWLSNDHTAVSEETGHGFAVHRSMETGEVVGLTIHRAAWLVAHPWELSEGYRLAGAEHAPQGELAR